MGKKSRVLSRVAAQFFSDTHTFHKHNGGVPKHLQKLYASNADQIYFVGDTTDFEYVVSALEKKGYGLENFPTDFMKVLDVLKPHNQEMHLRFYDAMNFKAAQGKEIIFLGGNHDEGMDLLDGRMINGLQIKKETTYDAGQYGRYHVEHGQHFDEWFGKGYSDWVSEKACRILDRTLELDYEIGQKFESMKEAYAFTNVLKGVAKSVGVVKPFKNNALAKAFNLGADGVICGHIHKSANVMEEFGGRQIRYLNTGDGLTHGTSWTHNEGVWSKLKRKALPESAKDILEPSSNILEKYRPQSIEFLKAGWRAQLEYLHSKARAKHAVKNEGLAPVLETA